MAIGAAMVVSTAVLTAALMVGDSVRMSLERMTRNRLGSTEYIMPTGDRYFRAALAGEVAAGIGATVAPVLTVRGIAVNSDRQLRLPDTRVHGIGREFPEIFGMVPKIPARGAVWISANTAEKLSLRIGDPLVLRLDRITFAPQNAPFISENQPTLAIRVTVEDILPEEGMGNFAIEPNQVPPFNLFIDREELATLLELNGLANLMLVSGNGSTEITPGLLHGAIEKNWKPADIGLRFRSVSRSGEMEITSGRVFIDTAISGVIQAVLPGNRSILTYLVNSLSHNQRSTPYSFVTAAPGRYFDRHIATGDILINEWLADDLQIQEGDTLWLVWYKMGPLRQLTEDSAAFRVTGICPVTGDFAGPGLMPDFPGISGETSCRNWETGAPIDLKRIRDKDEAYWNEYRGTPKAFITRENGIKYWENPFGSATAIRLDAGMEDTLAIGSLIMSHLKPGQLGMEFLPVASKGIQAARESTDFGELFISLSFFIIAAGLLLTGLGLSLFLRRRISEVAIMLASGITRRQAGRLLFGEAMSIAILANILGVPAGILVCQGLLAGLNTLWTDTVRTTGILPGIVPSTLMTGFVAGLVLTLLVVWVTLFRNLKRPLIPLIRTAGFQLPATGNRPLWLKILTLILIAGPLLYAGLLGLTDHLTEPLPFLLAGGIMLAGLVAGLRLLLSRRHDRSRALSAITMLALGVFSIIVTGANRQTGYTDISDRRNGTGGFLFWAETTIPLMYNPGTPEGRKKLGLEDEPLLEGLTFLPIQKLDGQDASCLNLHRAYQPPLLGIDFNDTLLTGAFTFATLLQGINPWNPWEQAGSISSGTVAAVADQTVIQWGLGLKVGDTIVYNREDGAPMPVFLSGGLANSVFQGHLLIPAEAFRNAFPSVRGVRVLLINGPSDRSEEIRELLMNRLADYGLVITTTAERLSAFNSVQNTYLEVFMLLSALGVILGTIGFGLLVMQNILDRRGELALRMAIGFRQSDLMRMLVKENTRILMAGLATGILPALVAVIPLMVSPAYSAPWPTLLLILLLISLSSFAWIWFPARRLMREELVTTLREES